MIFEIVTRYSFVVTETNEFISDSKYVFNVTSPTSAVKFAGKKIVVDCSPFWRILRVI